MCIVCIYNYNIYIYIPPHSASCPRASAVFAPVAGWKRTTSASCRGWCHHVCKWSICASGWMKEHHEHKLQLVTTTTWASGMFAPVERRETSQAQVQRSGCKVQRSGHKVQRSGCKVQRSGPASALVGTGCSNNMQLQPPPPPTMQHNAEITATCVRARLAGEWWALTQVAVIAASCCVGHICMVGGAGGCSCMLLLHPIPTSADAGPDLCTLCPVLCTLHPDLWTLC